MAYAIMKSFLRFPGKFVPAHRISSRILFLQALDGVILSKKKFLTQY